MVAVPVPAMRFWGSSNVQQPVLSGNSSPIFIWRTGTSCVSKYSALTAIVAHRRPTASRDAARKVYSLSPLKNVVSTGSTQSGRSKVNGTLELTETVKSFWLIRRTPRVCTLKYSSASLKTFPSLLAWVGERGRSQKRIPATSRGPSSPSLSAKRRASLVIVQRSLVTEDSPTFSPSRYRIALLFLTTYSSLYHLSCCRLPTYPIEPPRPTWLFLMKSPASVAFLASAWKRAL